MNPPSLFTFKRLTKINTSRYLMVSLFHMQDVLGSDLSLEYRVSGLMFYVIFRST